MGRNYTDEDVRKFASEVKNLGALLKKLNLRSCGGNYDNMRRTLQRLNLECSHWEGTAWNRGMRLKDWSNYTEGRHVKQHLIRDRGYRCERCKRSEWEGQQIPLEVEHKNGDKTDNRKENLELLCCNCHALTPTWKGRNKKQGTTKCQKTICKECQSEFPRNKKQVFCSCKCFAAHRSKNRDNTSQVYPTKISWPSTDRLRQMVEEEGFLATGRFLGVSDNAIRKRLKRVQVC